MAPGDPLPTLMQLIRDLVATRAATSRGAALADVHGHSLSYADLLEVIDRTAGDLASAGLAWRAVATVVRNGPSAAATFLSVSSAGACAPLNPALKRGQASELIRSLAAAAVVLEEGLEGEWAAAAADAGVPVIGLRQEDPAGAFRLILPARIAPTAVAARSEALLLTTSGTTAAPKVVGLSHEGLLWTASVIARGLELGPPDVAFNVMPLFHIHGLVACLLAPLAAGSSVVCSPGFDPAKAAGWIGAAGATYLSCVPTIHQALLRTAATRPSTEWAGSLRVLRSSSAPLDPTTWKRLSETFHVPVVQAYAMTEASHQMASVPMRESGPDWVGTVGLPDAAEARVVADSGHEAGPAEEGEILVRGRGVITGYLAPSAANEAAFVDGWLRTGDRGYLDDGGKLRLTGRSKEFINRGGTKISPYQVEAEILAYPGVRECAVYPVAHPSLGEEVAVALVAEEEGFELARLREFLQTRLPEDRIPHLVRVVPELPVGPTGKVQRLGLAAQLAAASQPGLGPDSGDDSMDAIRRILDRPDLGRADDFFVSGGDSIALAEFSSWLSDTQGVEFEAAELLERGTSLGAILDVVGQAHGAGDSTGVAAGSLTVFQPGRTGETPFVCVLAHMGQAIFARRLAARLPEYLPVLGVLLPATLGDEPVGLSAMVEACRAELARAEVEEFHLFGMCLGATVALQVARFERAVRSITVLDPFPIRPGIRSRMAYHVAAARVTGLWRHLVRSAARRVRLVASAATGSVERDEAPSLRAHRELSLGDDVRVPAALVWSAPFEAADKHASVRWQSLLRHSVAYSLNATHEEIYTDIVITDVQRAVRSLVASSRAGTTHQIVGRDE